jgi:acyl-CoA reductase-like NAD-dependent aldehyde dehydrogenase
MTKQLTTINPATEEVINTYDVATKEQIKEKTKKAHNVHLDWKKLVVKSFSNQVILGSYSL